MCVCVYIYIYVREVFGTYNCKWLNSLRFISMCRGFPEVDEGLQARRVPEPAYQPKGSSRARDGFGSSKGQSEVQTQASKDESCHL